MINFITIAIAAMLMISSCVKDNPAHVRGITVNEDESIQDAVDAALPGQTIYIKPGTYPESIVVNKANIKLIGLNGGHDERVIIQNPGDAEE